MQRANFNRRLAFVSLILPGVYAFAFLWSARAAQPAIEFIDFFLKDQVLLHFDTEPNRTYVLQYTDSAPSPTNGFQGANWSNLFTAPAYPFANHFIVQDTRTAPHRFYRLAVTP